MSRPPLRGLASSKIVKICATTFVAQQRRSDEVVTVGYVTDRRGRSGAVRIGDPPLRPSLNAGRGRGTDFPVQGDKIPSSARNRESSATP